MKKIISFLIVLVAIINVGLSDTAYGQTAKSETSMKPVKLTHEFFTVPAGVSFRAVVTAAINSSNAYAGQLVSLVLNSDFYYNNGMIAPVGSIVSGSVIDVSKAKHGSLNAKMKLRFTSIITPDGLNIPISAIVNTDNKTGVLMGGSKFETSAQYVRDNTKPTPIPANAISPMSINRGSSVSGTAGDGGGLVKSIWDKGQEVEIPANAYLELVLTQPITVKTKFSQN